MFWLNNGFEKKINLAFFIEVTSSNFIDICAYTAFESFHNHAFMKSQISILWQNLVGTVSIKGGKSVCLKTCPLLMTKFVKGK